MSAPSVAGFFNKGLIEVDNPMGPFFGHVNGDADEKQTYKAPDPYPLMYLDDQSQVVMGMPSGDLGSHQAQYMTPTLVGPDLGAASSDLVTAPPATWSPAGATDGSASPSSERTSSTRARSGSLSGDDAAIAGSRKKGSKKAGRRRKGDKVSDEEKDAKRDSMLARNRAAALKCRRKKKVFVSDLERQRIEAERQNQRLVDEHTALMNEVTRIKNSIMEHASCNDPQIDKWFGLEARRFVQATRERYIAVYGDADPVTFTQLLAPAATHPSTPPSEPTVTSEGSAQRGSDCGSVVTSSRRSSIAGSQGAFSDRS
ncbi:hypothetical protein MAPG_11633 [Magnaporthiopsis poae ATCC 64411]|uniref:BZIP domain-containing protein n=1 Tax=Magnaporthiopsis poae (strain ATCC 64411 / 73-15) TaxID=644358 RepID=A0A0C4EFS7_MAGP6|nr:hypothetical protein MAPG_11633 [Magnaporthiopsis poae ATCC 64411]